MPHAIDLDTVSISSAGTERFNTPRRDDAQSVVTNLKARAQHLEAELQRCETEAATLKNREHSLKEQNKKLSRVLEEKDTGLMQAKTREAQLTAEHSEQVYRIQQQHSAGLEALRAESRKATQQLQAQLQQTQLHCEETNYQLQQAKAKIQMMQQQLEQQRSSTVERASQLELEVRQKESLTNELKKTAERLKEQLVKKEKKLEMVMQQIRQNNVDDETRSTLLKQKLVECTTRLREIEEQYSNLQSHRDEHEYEARHQQQLYELQQENLRATEALKAEFRRKEQTMVSQLQHTKENIADLEFLMSQERTKYTVLEQRCRQLEGMTHDNELYMKEVEQQQQRLDLMQQKLQESSSRIQTLQERERAIEHSHVTALQNAQDKHEKLVLQIQGEYRGKESSLQTQLQALSLGLEDSQTQRASQETKITALEIKLHAIEGQSNTHRERASELEYALKAKETAEAEGLRRIEQLKQQVKEQEATLQDALGKLRLLINKSTSLHENMESERTKLQLMAAEVRADGDVHLESVILKMCRKMQSNDNTIEYPKSSPVFKALYSRIQTLARNNAVLSDEIVALKNRNFTRDDEKSSLKEKVKIYEDRLSLLERLLGDRDKEKCVAAAQTDLKGGRFLKVPETEDSGLQVELSPPRMSASSATNETEISMASVSSGGPAGSGIPAFLPPALAKTASGAPQGQGGDSVLNTLGEMQSQIQILQQRLEQKELHITRYTEANSKVNVENLKTDLQQISKQFSHLRRKVDSNNDVDSVREECKRLLSLALNKEAAIAELQSRLDELTKREEERAQHSTADNSEELEKCYSTFQRIYVQMVSACEAKHEASVHDGDIINRVHCALSDLLSELRSARDSRTKADVVVEVLRKELSDAQEKGNYSTIDRLAVKPNGNSKKSKTVKPSTHVVHALEAIVGDLKTHNKKFEEKILGDSQSVTDLDALLESMQQLQNLIRVSDTKVRELVEVLQGAVVELQATHNQSKGQALRWVVESIKLAESTLTDYGTMEETCHWILYSCISTAVGLPPSAPTSPMAGPRQLHGALFSPPAAVALSRSPTKTREVLGTGRGLHMDAQSQYHLPSPPDNGLNLNEGRPAETQAMFQPRKRTESPSDRKTSKGDSIIQDLVRHTTSQHSPQMNGRVRRIARSARRHSFTA